MVPDGSKDHGIEMLKWVGLSGPCFAVGILLAVIANSAWEDALAIIPALGLAYCTCRVFIELPRMVKQQRARRSKSNSGYTGLD
jgi:hypothetical protein